jgi:hypothetical protein
VVRCLYKELGACQDLVKLNLTSKPFMLVA